MSLRGLTGVRIRANAVSLMVILMAIGSAVTVAPVASGSSTGVPNVRTDASAARTNADGAEVDPDSVTTVPESQPHGSPDTLSLSAEEIRVSFVTKGGEAGVARISPEERYEIVKLLLMRKMQPAAKTHTDWRPSAVPIKYELTSVTELLLRNAHHNFAEMATRAKFLDLLREVYFKRQLTCERRNWADDRDSDDA